MLHFDTAETRTFWEQACQAAGIDPASTYHAGTFAEPVSVDRAAFIDQLADMARDGAKRGTAHMLLQFEQENIRMREPGDFWLVTTTQGIPVCLVRVTAVAIIPFADVGAEFAASEGEGDLSVDHWRGAHSTYFKRQCERWGEPWHDRRQVVCESFDVVLP